MFDEFWFELFFFDKMVILNIWRVMKEEKQNTGSAEKKKW